MPNSAATGKERHDAGSAADRAKQRERNADRSLGGYMSGNPYPGYRGPVGTRNPKAKPEPASSMPKEKTFSRDDPVKTSIWDRVFQPRRTRAVSPSYDLTVENVMQAMSIAPTGPLGVVKAIAGAIGVPGIAPEYTGYRGQVTSPGTWDAKNFALNFPRDFQAIGGLPDYAWRFYNSKPR